MSKKYRVYQVDSFTKELFKGNPAGVVPNADGLNEKQMRQIARELNNSETAFILSPAGNDHAVWIRFFTPTIEVPSCGHATVAAHYVRAKENNLGSCRIIQKIGAGILPVDIIKEDDDYKIIMTQGKIEFIDPLESTIRTRIITALNITEEVIDQRCPVQIVSTGHSKVLIGIRSQRTLDTLQPNNDELSRISKEINCNGYFAFTFDSNEKNILTKGRMFAPAIGINEDPVTGNANGPLGAYIIKHKLVKNNGVLFSFKSKQGETIGREGTIDVEVDIENGNPHRVRIGGYARIVFRTEVEI
jgi:PhzF family phenazine biosynthesis protein